MSAEARLALEPLRVDHAALYRFTGGVPPSERSLRERSAQRQPRSPG